jgi:hypothetical protein
MSTAINLRKKGVAASAEAVKCTASRLAFARPYRAALDSLGRLRNLAIKVRRGRTRQERCPMSALGSRFPRSFDHWEHDMTATTFPEQDTTSLALASTSDRFPAPTGKGCRGGQLVLAIGPFRDWLQDHMIAQELTAMDVARRIGRDEAIVRGWFGVRSRDWRSQRQDRFVVHVIGELVVEYVGIALVGNPRLVCELYAHMAEPVCQHCGAMSDCDHLGQDLDLEQFAA